MSTQQHIGKEQEAPPQAPASLHTQQTVPQEKGAPAQVFPQPPQQPPRPRATRWVVIGTVILVLALMLSLGIILIPSLIQRPGAQVTPTPTAPVAPVTPTPGTTTTPTPGFTVYTGKGYSISYPQGWTVTAGDQQVSFTGASGIYSLVILVNPNPDGAVDANTMVNESIAAIKEQMTNPQTETLPATTTVGGESWVQKSISGTEPSNGQSVDLQVVVISADNHPANAANTQNFTIEYVTEKSLFATANTSYFQPMLRSFKFT